VTGLGIIDTDLCMWAGTVTPEMMEAAQQSLGHPTIKAKPAPVVQYFVPTDWLSGFNCWIGRNPILAALLLGTGYVLLRRTS
jgi:hypothetical protein